MPSAQILSAVTLQFLSHCLSCLLNVENKSLGPNNGSSAGSQVESRNAQGINKTVIFAVCVAEEPHNVNDASLLLYPCR